MSDSSQTKLLRLAAFLVDALSISLILVLPASLVSYAMAWIGGSDRGIQRVWWVALGILLTFLLFRDGRRGRSMGKRLLGLRLVTRSGDDCGYLRSVVRNFPLIIPGWNLLEALMVLVGKARTGDRIAGTAVTEE